MARRIRLEPHLAVDELARRYRAAKDPHERSWWQIVWLLAQGQTATRIAQSTGYSAYWIGQIAKRYNEQGPEGMHNRQHQAPGARPLLTLEQLRELAAVVRGPAPEGALWTGRLVAVWMSDQLGRPVSVFLGCVYLRRLGGRRRTPRPRHVQADPAAQAAFKKSSARS
jgi:transposase